MTHVIPSALIRVLVATTAFSVFSPGSLAAEPVTDRHLAGSRLDAVQAGLPLAFEPGPASAGALSEYRARGRGFTVVLRPAEQVLVLAGAGAPEAPVRLRLVGANPAPALEPLDLLPGRAHYFQGPDPGRWRRDVPRYGRVAYRQVYEGIDLVYYGHEGQLEHDFVLAPGADPGRIGMAVDGAGTLALDGDDARLHTGSGEVQLRRPLLYQTVAGVRREVQGRFVLRAPGVLGFRVGAYDRTRPLVIDPALVYSTYLGGGNRSTSSPYEGGVDEARAVAVDAAGNTYVTGATASVDFPATAGTPGFPPGRCQYGGYCPDVFVTKLDPAGRIVYSVFLGGGYRDVANALAVDGSGQVYVAGVTESPDFPTTPGAFQRSHGGTTCGTHYYAWLCGDAFVAKLAPDGSALAYSTLLGGNVVEEAFGVAVDGAGQAVVTGQVSLASTPGPPGPPPDFPAVNALQPSFGGGSSDGFVAKLNAGGSGLVYSTYLGGTGDDAARALAVDASGNAYVAGMTGSSDFRTTGAVVQPRYAGDGDGFVAKLDPAGSMVFATFLGGPAGDDATGIALDPARNVYVTGATLSGAGFPQRNPLAVPAGGQWDVFVTKLTPDGAALSSSTLFGGTERDWGSAIAVDGAGTAYVTGLTTSADMPTVAPVQPFLGNAPCPWDACADAFVVALGAGGLQFATYLGGSNTDVGRGIAVDGAGAVHVAGVTGSAEFPTANAAQTQLDRGCGAFGCASDAFVAKITTGGPPPPVPHLLTFTRAPAGTPNPAPSGAGVALAVTAVDTLDHPIAYGWTASCPWSLEHGRFSDPAGPAPSWTPPLNTAGVRLSCTITVAISDGHGLGQTASFAQEVDPTIGHVLTLVGELSGSPNPVPSAGSVALRLVARDSLGHALSIAWTAACPGLPSAGAFAGTWGAVWTAPANRTGALQSCTLRVTVSDGTGLSATGAYAQVVEPEAVPVALGLSANRPIFAPGDTLVATLSLQSAAASGAVDLYLGVLLPDGDTIVFLTEGGAGAAVGRASSVAAFRPIAAGVPLETPLAVGAVEALRHTWTGGEPAGTYTVFFAATRPGVLADGAFDPGDLVALRLLRFDFQPAAPGG